MQVPFAQLPGYYYPLSAFCICDHAQQNTLTTLATSKAYCGDHVAAAGWEEDMYHPLLQTCRAFQPDVIVADMTTLAAHDVAESLKLPLALLGSMPLSLALDLTGQFNTQQHGRKLRNSCMYDDNR